MEEFRPIKDFDMYEVSNFGRVKNKHTSRILKQSKNKDGYYNISLYINNVVYLKRVHRLVAIAFIPNPDNKPIVDHIDNNPLNNNLSNLRWASNSENNFNQKLSKNNTSGFKGVRWNKRNQRWIAIIKHNRKTIHLGSFVNKEDAIIARAKKAQELFGEYINKCEIIQTKRKEIDEELEALEKEFEELINN